MTTSPDTASPTRILFIEKVFLKRNRAPLRGVELFNLNLMRGLMQLGYEVSFIAERSWKPKIEAELGADMPACRWICNKGSNAVNALCSIPGFSGKRYDVLLIANVGNGLIPMIRALKAMRVFERSVLIAHREASARFVDLCRKLDTCVVSVNQVIARPFEEAGCSQVAVDYGVLKGEAFYPAAAREARTGAVNLCVMGMLDNAWKGSDTAVAAFRMLPEAVRAKACLHLASFSHPPEYPGENIRPYPWMPFDQIPEFLRTMDVLLVPSRDEEVMRETFSQVTVQGMLCGLPVLANDLPILAEKFDVGGGLLSRSVAELAEQMEQLIGDPALRLRLGAEARKTALERYIWQTDRFAQRYLPRSGRNA